MLARLSRAVAAWAVLAVVQAVAGALLLPRAPAPDGGGWLLLGASNAIVTAVAGALAARLAERGWRRVLALLAVLWGVHASNLIEAVFYPIGIPPSLLPLLLLDSFVVLLALAAIIARLVPAAGTGASAGAQAQAEAAGSAAWPGAGAATVRVGACALGYAVIYLGAGLLAWPFLREFYEHRALPGLSAVLAVQVVRGLAFSAILALLAYRLAGRRTAVALLSGLTLALLGAVAPLILPNPYLPVAVRMVHLCEIGISNFLFGWLGSLLLTRGQGLGRTAARALRSAPRNASSSA